VIWMILGGGVVVWLFLAWENRQLARGAEPLVDPSMLRNRVLRSGLTAFFFQYLLQAGLFFAIPLFLSVALGLSAVETGVRLLPLSVTLLLAAVGVPRFLPDVSPRRVVQVGFLALFAGIAIMVGALDAGAGPEIVTWPMLLAGLGVGALASQLGSVTVSSVADEQSGEVGGLQNTVMYLGASIGTALAGAVLTTTLLTGIEQNATVSAELKSKATTQLSGNVSFVADDQLQTALDEAGVPPQAADAVVQENATARIDGLRSSLSVLALIALIALFFSRRIPTVQPGSAAAAGSAEDP
jgi:predicted MFS family arabinose efflux permease